MYLLLIYTCSITCLTSILLGHKFGDEGCQYYLVLSQLIGMIISIYIFYEVCILHLSCYIELTAWIVAGTFVIQWSFVFDQLTSMMLLVILTISLCANIYSVEYMCTEPLKIRFFSTLSLFTSSMVILVTANTLIQLFLGWELVGLTSYLLINYWYTRLQANKSSLLAIFTNKVGDISLLLGSVLLYTLYNDLDFYTMYACAGSLDLEYLKNLCIHFLKLEFLTVYFIDGTSAWLNQEVFTLTDIKQFSAITETSNLVCAFLLLAALCKSAQAGFHFWLAEAMEGPTPVSSLLHAATMVTAGVFLLTRCNVYFNTAYSVSIVVLFLGAITSLVASLIGFFQTDLKKVVAYSTCSQLGYMFCGAGINSYDFSMFHLFNHAFFKALLFLTSGYLIHVLSNEQNVKRMGGVVKILPLQYICFLIGSCSLMGIPFFSGFFSKDLIVEKICNIHSVIFLNSFYSNITYISQLLLLISLVITILYSIKLIFFIFFHGYAGTRDVLLNFHFSSWSMTLPLFFLCLASIISGYICSDLMLGIGSLYWGEFLESFYSFNRRLNVLDIFYYLQIGELPFELNKYLYYSINMVVLYYVLLGCVTYTCLNALNVFLTINTSQMLQNVWVNFSNKLLCFNRLYIKYMILLLYHESYTITYKFIDKHLIEYIGPFGMVGIFWTGNVLLSKVTLGLIYHYSGILNIALMVLFIAMSWYLI